MSKIMDIRTARKIAKNVGSEVSHNRIREAFYRLDLSYTHKGNKDDLALMQEIWNFFANLAIKGKTVQGI